MTDLLIDKAISLRGYLNQINLKADQNSNNVTLATTSVMNPLEKACRTCVEMGENFLVEHNLNAGKETHQIFDKLVEEKVIESSLSRRLLSLISYGKLLSQASRIKGKNCQVKLNQRHLEDMHTFTQNLLLS